MADSSLEQRLVLVGWTRRDLRLWEQSQSFPRGSALAGPREVLQSLSHEGAGFLVGACHPQGHGEGFVVTSGH